MLPWRPSMPTSAFRVKDPPQAFSTFGFLPSSQLSVCVQPHCTISPKDRACSPGLCSPCPKERIAQARPGLLPGGLRSEHCHFVTSPPLPAASTRASMRTAAPAAEGTRWPAPSGPIRLPEIPPAARASASPPGKGPPPLSSFDDSNTGLRQSGAPSIKQTAPLRRLST